MGCFQVAGSALAGMVALAACLPALGAECSLERARYREPGSGAVLTFSPYALPTPYPVSASTSHLMTLDVPDIEGELWGSVSGNQGMSRPVGTLGFACGDPDIDPETADDTGNYPDVPFCTLWQGVVYALVAGEGIVPLPFGDAPAPQQVLLTDLARTLHYGQPAFPEDAVVPPDWGTSLALADVLVFEGCAP